MRTADAALVHAAPARCPDGGLVVPMAVLAAVGGAGDDPVELAAGPGLTGEARWAAGGVPRTHPFDALPPGKQHRPPAPPAHWHPAPPALLAALHECGRTAARDGGGRYALTRVQVRASTGQVVGTDGKVAMLWGGLALPVGADVLVPAVPVFGAKEFVRAGAVRVGRTTDDVVVAAGPWRVHLPVGAARGTYPDVAAAAPRAAPTAVDLDPRDAAELREQLPGLPGAATSAGRSPWTWPTASPSSGGTSGPAEWRRCGWPGRPPPARRPGSQSTGGCSPAPSPSAATPSGSPAPTAPSHSRTGTARSSPSPSTPPARSTPPPATPPPPSFRSLPPRGGP